MATEPIPMPDGEIFIVSDRLMLVHEIETIATAGFLLGREGKELAIHLTARGRINHSTEQSDITLAFSPEGTVGLIEALLHSLEATENAGH